MPVSKFQEALHSGKFLVTVGIKPPKGTNQELFLGSLEGLADRVDAVNFSDNRSAKIQMSALAASLLAKDRGIEPILAISCRDRNRLALSSDLIGAYALGLRNLLCVTGDYLTFGDAVEGRPVYDLDSVQTIQMIRQMENGKDIGGNDLDGAPVFCVGCVANPQAVPLEPQLLKLEKKLIAGAEFIQTLDLYNLDRSKPFFSFLKERDVKVLAGIRFITEREVRLSEERRVPGNPIPEAIKQEIKNLESTEEIAERAKIRMTEMIKRLKDSGLCHGVHLTVEGREELIPEMIKEAGI